MNRLKATSEWFTDPQGRKVILRGVNLGGDTKVPYPNGGTHFPTDFKDHLDVSFIGRPFPLAEADEHFLRLKKWGFNCLRLLTTWEAVEHKGPSLYDIEYLDYLTEIVRLAGEYGFYLFIDFHQDVWSRMSGGDGAPGWLFEKIGMDFTKFTEADAAIVMQGRYDYSKPGTRQENNYPTMCWSQNYRFSANAIMWTLFFGGKDFAPSFMIDGMNVQDYLQSHYLNSMIEVGKRILHFDHVLGFDSLNEPGKGFIGRAMNDRGLKGTAEEPAKPGLAWSPIDALFSSHGHTIELPYLKLSVLKGGYVPAYNQEINPNKISIWTDNSPGDPFQLEGAWTLTKDGTPFIEKNDFFQNVNGQPIDFDRDYMIPFIRKVGDTIRSLREDWMTFAEREAADGIMKPEFNAPLPPNSVNATHWYDLLTLIFKKFVYPITIDPIFKVPVFGKGGVVKMYVRHLSRIKDASSKIANGIPTLIGEFGIPFDLKAGKAYKQWKAGIRSHKIWKSHILALTCMYDAMDTLFLNNTLWNYTASNENDLMKGDGWNQEDLSIYSKDQKIPGADVDLYGGGGRAIEGFCRPYAYATQGTPLQMKFIQSSGTFVFEWQVDTQINAPTLIVIPRFVYPKGVSSECLNCRIMGDQNGILEVIANNEGKAKVILHRL